MADIADQLTLFEIAAADVVQWSRRQPDETDSGALRRADELEQWANELAALNCSLSAEILRGCARRLRAAIASSPLVMTVPADCEPVEP